MSILQESLQNKVDEIVEKERIMDMEGEKSELSQDDQIKVIEAVKGRKKGTRVCGESVRRPPLPRGGAAKKFRAYESIQEELEANKEELRKTNEERAKEREEMDAFKRDMEAKFAALVEQVRMSQFSAPPAAAQCPTDGSETQG